MQAEDIAAFLYRFKSCIFRMVSLTTRSSSHCFRTAFLFFASFSCTLLNRFAFAERSAAVKAPVGLLNDRTVLRSKMEGPYPDKFT